MILISIKIDDGSKSRARLNAISAERENTYLYIITVGVVVIGVVEKVEKFQKFSKIKAFLPSFIHFLFAFFVLIVLPDLIHLKSQKIQHLINTKFSTFPHCFCGFLVSFYFLCNLLDITVCFYHCLYICVYSVARSHYRTVVS